MIAGEPPPDTDVSRDLDAAAGTVWALVGNFAALRKWHPDVRRCDVRMVGGAMERTAYFDDWWLTERVTESKDEAMVLSYVIISSSKSEVVGARARIEVEPVGAENARMRWIAWAPPGANADPSLSAYYARRIDHARAELARSREATAR